MSVPTLSIAFMALAMLFAFATPFLLLAYYRKRGAQVLPFFVGCAVFIVFALVLESLVHSVVLKGLPVGEKIMGSTWLYALYGGLMAGLFEETGRFLAMKFLMRREPGTALPGVAYGIGHGGTEMLLIFGITMISNLVMSVMINAGQADTLIAAAPAEAQEQLQGQFAQLSTLTAGTLLIGFWERLSALVLQLGLSMMVWTAVRRSGKWLWLFPAAILLHALVDGVAVVLSKSVGMVAVEVIICAMAVAAGATGWMLGKRLELRVRPMN